MKSFRIDDILVDSSKQENVASTSSTRKAESLEEDITSEDEPSHNHSPECTERTWIKTEKPDDDQYQLPFAPKRIGFGDVTKLPLGYSKIGSSILWPYHFSQTSSKDGRYPSSSSYPSGLHSAYYTAEEARMLLKMQARGGVLKHYGGNASHLYSLSPLYHPLQRGGNVNATGGVEYHYAPATHGYPTAHYGIPTATLTGEREAYFQNGQYNNDRDHYPAYSLSRPLYASSCKRKGGQIRFNNSQTGQLEKAFLEQKYLNATDRKKLAQSLGLSDRQVKTWFQNRRAKLRKSKGMLAGLELPQTPPDHHQNASPRYDDSPIGAIHDVNVE